VRTGAAARFGRVEPEVPPPLVRVRGAEDPLTVPFDAELLELCEPLAAVRGAAETVRRPVPVPVARVAPLEERCAWARSWRTTWTVRRITCVRTSTAGFDTCATWVSLGPERSV